MRIIAGTAKGRNLKVPKNGDLRPTSDRAKETIFNVLGQWLEGERVLDLYAGVGSLGLESISRGAEKATFVEQDKFHLEAITDNARAFGYTAQCVTVLRPVERAIRQLGKEGATFTLVFSDPPYALRLGKTVLEALDAAKLVVPRGRVVIEHDRREELPERVGAFARDDERRFGDTQVSFYTRRTHPEGEA